MSTLVEKKGYLAFGERGFLSNYPADVIAVVNGQPITKSDILNGKRKRQHRILAARRQEGLFAWKPVFVWVLYKKDTCIYGGWWLYVRALRGHWIIESAGRHREFFLPIMRLFPCNLLPMVENSRLWQEAFAKLYHRPTQGRPENSGMTIAWAKVSWDNRLLDIRRGRPSAHKQGERI